VLKAIAVGVGGEGVYAAVVGGSFRAGATRFALPKGEAARLATAAFKAHRSQGLSPTLLDFVDRVESASSSGTGSGGNGRGHSNGRSLLPLLALLAAGGGLFYFVRNRRRRQVEAVEFQEVRAAAQDDLVALAGDIQKVDIPAQLPTAPPEAQQQYEQALASYDEASHALDRARHPQDLAPVTAALEQGRFAMASALASIAGKPLPERRPPCFFDPRHGPSTREVEWAPDGGAPREVPACEADAQRVERGLEPASREVLVGGRPTPYYYAPAYFSPWAGGYFGGFGGMGGFFPGLIFGEMLGGGFGYGGFGGGYGLDGGGYDGDFGGDLGGGGLGGDFGGGGDIGGGDFGGGGDF
jgi:hypothetical protein